ncbi:MAG: phosphoribosyltransferase [Betaproteobacteria bacterium]|nr:phosphoribosyltransferase [Betaproteobacteria bacterium]
MDSRFEDRFAAGRALARALQAYAAQRDVLVLGLPRGGVPVAFEVARALGAELDVLIVRKLGVPHQPELAMGAISSGDALYLNRDLIALTGVTKAEIESVLEAERKELARRELLYRGSRPAVRVEGRTVIVVDDGIATGASMHAALLALRSKHPGRIVVAVPVAPAQTQERLGAATDVFISVMTPEPFYAVGQFYEHFDQTSDEEVRTLLERSRAETR